MNTDNLSRSWRILWAAIWTLILIGICGAAVLLTVGACVAAVWWMTRIG
jgi:LPS O-antigen subunit length determinant protein (WzzB/FepE family)